MTEQTVDRAAIADLMTGWMHRDQGEWEALKGLFHEDATIDISWFQGRAHDFVEASAGMAASKIATKHLFAAPQITFSADGTRAFSETNAMIVGENAELGLGCTTHSRLADRLEKREGVWRISHRECIYDFSHFDFPYGPVEIDRDAVARYPRGYAALCYLLELSGYPVGTGYATKGSQAEQDLKQASLAWLDENTGSREA